MQIRIVRCLWADIDNCDVAVALERVASVSLPYPTAVVNSGNGVHLYWRLDQPFVIDDAGPSIPVHIEPINSGESRKKARRYVLEGKDRVYLDQRHHLTKLSPKALQIQDVVAGIAEAIGGDHTTDLTRLLRVPGTYNRKDQRNGRQPILCELIECDASRSYALNAFAMFHKPSETTRRQRNIDAMPLPTIRKCQRRRPTSYRNASLSVLSLERAHDPKPTSLCVAMRSAVALLLMRFGNKSNRSASSRKPDVRTLIAPGPMHSTMFAPPYTRNWSDGPTRPPNADDRHRRVLRARFGYAAQDHGRPERNARGYHDGRDYQPARCQ